MCPGHERWHPNPGFYYLDGGGPMLDMGPYYVTDLVNLLGPVASVMGVATRTRSERIVASQPLKGARIPVEVATHVTGTLMFASGAAVSMTMSFDVARHRHVPIELYGETGSLIVPDPNYFGGKVEFATAAEDWREIPTRRAYADGNYRILGLADMAHAIRSGRPHRASGAARVPCARSDGGVPVVLRRRRGGGDVDASGAPGAFAAVAARRRTRLRRSGRKLNGGNDAGSSHRLGRLERPRAGAGRAHRRQDAGGT